MIHTVSYTVLLMHYYIYYTTTSEHFREKLSSLDLIRANALKKSILEVIMRPAGSR